MRACVRSFVHAKMRHHGNGFPVLVVATLSGLLCQLSVSNATVLLRTGVGFTPIPDAAAGFGSDIPLEGIFGHVLTVQPEDACASSITPTREKDIKEYRARDGLGWIALIKRSQIPEGLATGGAGPGGDSSDCSFLHKVRVATEAGASAVIVYDVVHEGLVTMSVADGARGKDSHGALVPSVFVSKDSGALLKAVIESSGLVQVIITPVSSVLDLWASFVMSVVAGCFALSLVMGAVCMVRYGTQGYDEEEDGREADGRGGGGRMVPLTKRDLRALTRVGPYRGGRGGGAGADHVQEAEEAEEADSCSICLQEYEPGEKVRYLPCQHVFHRDCVDEWLLGESRLCPMCKRSVVDAAQEQGAGGQQGAERASWWQQSWSHQSWWRESWQRWRPWWRGEPRGSSTSEEQEMSVLLHSLEQGHRRSAN